ncbi:hypothetical protein ATCC90586_012090 [Pythium insidiosum]|nr:hypothetical protein ATCC90586_012090 [Pythium insidiosum]
MEDELLTAARKGKIADVKKLLDAGVDVSAGQGSGSTALHYAAFYKHTDVVELLLEYGAHIDAKNKTPTQKHT